MTKHKLKILFFIILAAFFVVGEVIVNCTPRIKSKLMSQVNKWDDTSLYKWPVEFSVVQIKSSADDSFQPAYFFASETGIKKPLIVSLHTWSGDYSQHDPLADMAKNEGWNYIHPNFRGSNSTKDACLSEKVILDIDDAIQYATENSTVDKENIFVVGTSGGGYATLGVYLKTRHNIKAFLSWVPISDLVAWFHQSRSRNSKYLNDILACTSEGNVLNENEARKKSPLFMDIPLKPNGRLELYAGIDDGFTGDVPISHSILFFNRVVMHYKNIEFLIGAEDIVNLLTRGVMRHDKHEKIGGREVLYSKESENIVLKIFDGGHEMLPNYTFSRLKKIAEKHDALEGGY